MRRFLLGLILMYAGITHAQTCLSTEALFVAQHIHRLGAADVPIATATLWPTDRNDKPISFGDGTGIHLLDAGYALAAAAASRTINYTFGYGEGNPHIVTANTYAMADNDGVVDAQPTANATYTAPNCIGQTGATYRINNSQNAYTLTVNAFSASQLINGQSSVTVAPFSSLVLRDTLTSSSAAGCHFE